MKPKFRSIAAAFAPFSRASLIICASLGAVISASADQTWTGASDALWTTAANWNAAAPGASDVAIFDTTSIANLATTLNADISVLGVRIIDPAAAVSIATGNTLSLGASGIDMSAAAQNLTINSPVTLGAAQSWNVVTGRVLTVNGIIGGTVGVTKTGTGELSLVGANTFTGGVALNAGKLRIRNGNGAGATGNPITALDGTTILVDNSAFPGNPVTVSGTNANLTLEWGNSGGLALSLAGSADQKITAGGSYSLNFSSNTMQFQDFLGTVDVPAGKGIQFRTTSVASTNGGPNATFIINGTSSSRNGMNVNFGALTGSGKLAMGTSGSNNIWLTYHLGEKGLDTTFDGAIVDGDTANGKRVAINKKGGGVLKLTGTHVDGLTYTGTTTVTEGTLTMNGVKSGTGASTVNSGATLAGTGSLAGTTTVANGGILAPGDGGVGNITFSNLTLASGSVLNLEFGAGNDTATVSAGGTLTLNSGATVDVNGFGTDGTYLIIPASGATISGVAATALTAVNTDGGKIYTFSSDASGVKMTISSSDPSNYWAVDGDGAWDSASNWSKNEVPNAPSAIARFGPTVGGDGSTIFNNNVIVELNGDKTIGTLNLNDGLWGTTFTVAQGSSGSLLLDNGASASNIVSVTGLNAITAPVAVDAEGVMIEVSDADAANHSFSLSGEVSGAAAALIKVGPGELSLSGNNTYGAGTILDDGVIKINSSTSLGAVSGAARFAGGSLKLDASLFGITRSYQVAGTDSAIINTNGFDLGYDGVISPYSGGTGGLTKTGAGTMTLSAPQTYTGTTSVNGGTLAIDGVGAAMSLAAVNTGIAGGGLIHVLNGASLSGTTCTLGPQSAGLFMDTTSGLVTFSGALTAMNTTSNGNSAPIRVTGSTLSAPSIQLGRTGLSTTAEPTEAPANTNLYLNGGAVNVSGNLTIGTSTGSTAPQSSVVTRVDAGTLTVGGAISVGLNNGGRWSYIDINGGTLVNTGTGVNSGVVLGGPLEGKAAFLMRSGTATVERIQFGRDAVNGTALLKIAGGELYIGSEGITVGTTGTYASEIRLSGGTLAAKADWSTTLGATLDAASFIKAADALDAPFDITISGVISGAAGITKSGAGKLTLGGANTFTGDIAVNAGTLALTGDSSAATGAVIVADSAKLAGNGNIGGNVSLASGARHELAVAGTPGTQVTRVISGSLTLDAGNILDLTAAAPVAGGTYVLATVTGGIVGSPTTVNLPGGVSGSVSINGNNLELTVVGSGYSTWATANAGGQDPDGDFDNDGVSNGVEYFLGQTGSTFTANPGLVGGTVTWTNGGNIASSAYGTEFVVQTSTNLVSWTDVLAADPNLNNIAGSVSYTPTGVGKQFVRLKVTPN